MKVYNQWKKMTEALQGHQQAAFYDEYFDVERLIYKEILQNKDPLLRGSVSELSQRFSIDPPIFAGFLDGINESLETPLSLEELEEDSPIDVEINWEKLFSNMLSAKAKWLSGLPEWEAILSKERRLKLRRHHQLQSMVISENKVGRNDPCPCGSGKKHKHCCLNQ